MAQDKVRYPSHSPPKEGELYRRINISGQIFDVAYGYYEDFERGRYDPIPLYPNLRLKPVYTRDGYLIVTGMQDICEHYRGQTDGDSCIECTCFLPQEDLFGLCRCPCNRKETP